MTAMRSLTCSTRAAKCCSALRSDRGRRGSRRAPGPRAPARCGRRPSCAGPPARPARGTASTSGPTMVSRPCHQPWRSRHGSTLTTKCPCEESSSSSISGGAAQAGTCSRLAQAVVGPQHLAPGGSEGGHEGRAVGAGVGQHRGQLGALGSASAPSVAERCRARLAAATGRRSRCAPGNRGRRTTGPLPSIRRATGPSGVWRTSNSTCAGLVLAQRHGRDRPEARDWRRRTGPGSPAGPDPRGTRPAAWPRAGRDRGRTRSARWPCAWPRSVDRPRLGITGSPSVSTLALSAWVDRPMRICPHTTSAVLAGSSRPDPGGRQVDGRVATASRSHASQQGEHTMTTTPRGGEPGLEPRRPSAGHHHPPGRAGRGGGRGRQPWPWARPGWVGPPPWVPARRPRAGLTGAERDRPHRRGHDGEPVLRPHAGLAARRQRRAGRTDLRRPRRRVPRHLAPRHVPGPRSTAIPTTPTEAAGSSGTMAGATAGSRPAPTTSSRSATTPPTTWPSTASCAPDWVDLRHLPRVDHGADLPQPPLHAHGPDRPDLQHGDGISDPAHHLGLAGRRRRARPSTTTPTPPSSPCSGRRLPADRLPVLDVPVRLRGRHAALGQLRRPEVHRRVDRHGRRRPSVLRHPASGSPSSTTSTRAVTNGPGLGAHRAGHHLRRVGRLLRPRERRTRRPTTIRPTPCAGSGCPPS